MDKVIHSDKNITAFGGLNFIFKAIKDRGLDKYLDERLGARGKCARYSHSDIILSLLGNCLVQGSFVSDIEKFREKYQGQFFGNIPSADTVEYACQQLKKATIKDTRNKKVTHFVNYCNEMNQSLVGLAVKSGLLKAGGDDGYTLDFDNVIVEHDKQDAMRTYKNTRGYHPNLAFVGRIPVHIENHNGNTPAQYGQCETLKRCFENFKQAGVRISAFRADAASYQKELIPLVEAYTDNFYIRLNGCDKLHKQCGQVKQWNKVLINNICKEVASIEYTPFGQDQVRRAVMERTPKKDKQIDIVSETAYDYFGILTNNCIKSDQEVIAFYNQRGDAENSNRYMLNDFNLHHLPFSDMCTNTVFIYMMAMCATLFEWIKNVLVANKIKAITASMRVKAVCFHYITTAATYITHARKKVLKIFGPANTYFQLQV
jgi:hypothetical protein